jgi:uncharacterized membrane protein
MPGTDLQPARVLDVRAPRPNGLAAASLTLAIVGIVLGIIPLFIGLVLSFLPVVLALILGVVALMRAPARDSGYGLSVAGLLIAGLTVVLWFHGYGVLW